MAQTAETFQGLNTVLEDHRNGLYRCCQAVDRCLEVNRDNLRGFFEQCFSQLLKQIFGYEGSSWLNSVSKSGQDADAKALVGLLAPKGQLLRAIHAADLDSLIKFEFPLNRLPTHTQHLLRLESGRKALEAWPQYNKHIVVDRRDAYHVHLNVFEYFVFWTAFYVLRSSQSETYHPQTAPRGYSALTPSFGTVRKALGGGKEHPTSVKHPYLRLLKLYLDHFLPRGQPARNDAPSRGFGTPVRQRAQATPAVSKGPILLNVLVEFWLTDSDEPLPISVNQQNGQELADALKETSSIRVRSYQTPSDDLIGALTVLARHIVATDESREAPPKPALVTPWLPDIASDPLAHTPPCPSRLGEHGSTPAQVFAKRLFRFLWRALKFWPEQQSLTALVDLWLTYSLPWVPLHALDQPAPQSKPQPLHNLSHTFLRQPEHPSTSGQVQQLSISGWENHILANYPFYTCLLPLFVDLLKSRISTRGDSALRHFCKVMQGLKASPGLLELLKSVETDLSRYQAQPGRRPDGVHADILSFLADQRQHWQRFASAGLSPTDAQAVFLEMPLFSTEEGGLSMAVRDLLNAGAGAAKESLLQEAHALGQAVLPLDQLGPAHSSGQAAGSQQLSPVQGLKRGNWSDMRYKGDWMRRPLSSSEIGWLVRLLVYISDTINAKFGLNQHPSKPPASAQPETDFQRMVVWVQTSGFRFNLRPLGEKQTLAWLPICYLTLWLMFKFVGLLASALQDA